MKSYTLHGQYIAVPDVSGMFEDEAGKTLAAVGLKYEVLDYKYDNMTLNSTLILFTPYQGRGYDVKEAYEKAYPGNNTRKHL